MWDTNLMTSSVKTFKQHICLDFELRLKVTRQSPPALTFRSFWHAQEALQSYFLPYRVTHKVSFQTRLKLILFCACGQLCPSLRQRNLNHIVLKWSRKLVVKFQVGFVYVNSFHFVPRSRHTWFFQVTTIVMSNYVWNYNDKTVITFDDWSIKCLLLNIMKQHQEEIKKELYLMWFLIYTFINYNWWCLRSIWYLKVLVSCFVDFQLQNLDYNCNLFSQP